MRVRSGFVLLMASALVVHLAFVLASAGHAVPVSQDHFDARQYRELADSLARGDGFLLSHQGMRAPDLDRTPIYPLFLSLFGPGWDKAPTVFLIQHLLVLMTAVIVYRWARRCLAWPPGPLIAAGLVAYDLTTMTYASYLLTETLFTVFLTLAFATYPVGGEKHPVLLAMLAAASMGLATLTRPIAFYLLPLGLLISLVLLPRHPRAAARLMLAALCGGLVVGVWVARNHQISGRYVLSTIEGENLLHYRAALLGQPRDLSMEDWHRALRERSHERDYDRSIPAEAVALEMTKKKLALEIVLEHPLRTYRLFLVGIPRLLVSPNRSYLYALLGIRHDAWDLDLVGSAGLDTLRRTVRSGELPYLILSFLYQMGLVILAAIGAVLAVRHREIWALPLGIGLVYFVVASAGLETHARFRVPIVPLLALFAARAAQCLASRWPPVEQPGQARRG